MKSFYEGFENHTQPWLGLILQSHWVSVLKSNRCNVRWISSLTPTRDMFDCSCRIWKRSFDTRSISTWQAKSRPDWDLWVNGQRSRLIPHKPLHDYSTKANAISWTVAMIWCSCCPTELSFEHSVSWSVSSAKAHRHVGTMPELRECAPYLYSKRVRQQMSSSTGSSPLFLGWLLSQQTVLAVAFFFLSFLK